jgi:hypothetical protein
MDRGRVTEKGRDIQGKRQESELEIQEHWQTESGVVTERDR